jgi:hypothetical protein
MRSRSDSYSSTTSKLSNCSVNTDDDMGVAIWGAYLLQRLLDIYMRVHILLRGRISYFARVFPFRLTDCLLNKISLFSVCPQTVPLFPILHLCSPPPPDTTCLPGDIHLPVCYRQAYSPKHFSALTTVYLCGYLNVGDVPALSAPPSDVTV